MLNPRLAARASDGGFVVITAESAYRLMERGSGPEWRVYNYERWLPSDDLRGLALTDSIPDSPLYFATAAGTGHGDRPAHHPGRKIRPFHPANRRSARPRRRGWPTRV